MAGRIPSTFIDELLSRIDIIDVIDTRVPLVKKGREFQACCPFHHEKTPSFTVSPTKQFYHCFGCGAHGTAVGFLMEYENMPFPEAIEDLASQAGLEVPREDDGEKPRENLTPLFNLMERAGEWYRKQLKDHPQADKAIQYLKQRGLSGEIAASYGLGFAPDGWSNIHDALTDDHDKITTQQMTRTGLLIEKDKGGHYDRFRNRIIFPIHDSRGRIIGFGGRVLGDEKPKYLNSPESPLFHKGQELYGLYQARKNVRNLKHILVVEGYMDVVALAQFGIHYSVATLGTATTTDHLNQLFRTVTQVLFCFDGDRAGRDAARKAMNTAIPLMRDGREIHFMFLPDGEDPDSLVRKEGTKQFEQRISQAVPLSELFFSQLKEEANPDTIDGRARLVSLARPKLSRLPAGMFREMMFKRLSSMVEMDEDAVASHLLDSHAAKPASREPTTEPARAGQAPSPVRIALSILLHQPGLIKIAAETSPIKGVETPGIGLLTRVMETLQKNPDISSAALLERWRDREDEEILHKVAQWDPAIPDDGVESELKGALKNLHELRRGQRTDKLLKKSAQEPLSPTEKQELQELLSAN
ncbi:MAG: DNA primase [Gammaproteobacteria bacterium]|uniref:DNA primase n=1 Tax=Candidatus Thiopontia autotrophica TaxID=2841688 RepID=A0A8J6P7W9_9GAMM|nr:DNA primase [Candidatus Thiopontia autotrophica]MBL6968784.1 DNA primase [Gammaproteobacteria bacterium]